MPTIDGTKFGSITVDVETYHHDIAIRLSGKLKKRKKKLSKHRMKWQLRFVANDQDNRLLLMNEATGE